MGDMRGKQVAAVCCQNG